MKFVWIAVAAIVAIGAGTVLYYSVADAPSSGGGLIACTADAMQCPDGSYVGRTGPNCEFVCPAATSTPGGAGTTTGSIPPGVICTADAMQCPDGTWVGRSGRNCQFVCPGGNTIAPYTSGVRGTVMLGPICPVERDPPEPGCADRAYATEVSIYRASDTTRLFASTESDANGAYSVSLPPGQYVVGAGDGRSMLPRCGSVSVTVPPTGYVTANISCDTGIR